MGKYKWNDAKLQRKSRNYDWVMIAFAVIALAVYFFQLPMLFLLLAFAVAVVFYVLSWRVKSKDTKLKIKDNK